MTEREGKEMREARREVVSGFPLSLLLCMSSYPIPTYLEGDELIVGVVDGRNEKQGCVPLVHDL